MVALTLFKSVFYQQTARGAGPRPIARRPGPPFSRSAGAPAHLIALAPSRATCCSTSRRAVDAAREHEFYELLERLSADITIVLVTHDLGFVSRYVRSVACVNRRVLVHPTSDITGEMINQLYGSDVRMIRHDHRCAPEGHAWSNS